MKEDEEENQRTQEPDDVAENYPAHKRFDRKNDYQDKNGADFLKFEDFAGRPSNDPPTLSAVAPENTMSFGFSPNDGSSRRQDYEKQKVMEN